jgi:hypothetical protein
LRVMATSSKLRMPLPLQRVQFAAAQGTGRAVEAGLDLAGCWQTREWCACIKCLSSCQRSSHPVCFQALPLLHRFD